MKESYMRIITEGKRRCLPISVHELCNAPGTGSGTLESDVCVTVKKLWWTVIWDVLDQGQSNRFTH